MPLLEGTDGINKMSKSLGNYIGIAESPESMFGKVMSISDELMWRYYELLSFRSLPDIAGLRAAALQGRNPRDIKLELAAEITARFHGSAAAQAAQQGFMSRVSDKAVPTDLIPIVIPVAAAGVRIANLLKAAGLAASTSEANRKIDEGAVKLDGARLSDRGLTLHGGADHVLQVGTRRYARVQLVAA
jgi:tyrosyl-tRNA synthetase